jgi:hypothetical protein
MLIDIVVLLESILDNQGIIAEVQEPRCRSIANIHL